METAAHPAAPPPQHPGPGGRRIDWTPWDVFWGIGWFLTLFLLMPLPFALTAALISGDIESEGSYATNLIVGMGSEAGLVAVAAFFTFKKYGGGWDRLGIAMPTLGTVGWGVAALVGALVLGGLYGFAIDVFGIDALKAKCDDQVPPEVINSVFLMTLAGIAAIGFAPVCEEIFFRGFMFPGLTRNWGVVLGIIASSLIFSSAHIGLNIHKTIIPIFIIGAVFAAAYYRSGNIFTSIGAHMVFNSVSFAVLATGGCDPDDASALHSALGTLATVLGR
jgi:membrane protease YdiL (CAAX protease family)